MELHIATSKEAADYDYATFNGTRTLTLAAGKSSLVIKPGTIIGYRDGRNVVYVVTPDKGLNSEYKISEDDFDRKVAPKCDSATKAQARKAFSGKVEKPAATVAPKPITKSPVKQSKALVPMPPASSIKFKCPGFNGVDSAKTVKTLNALLDRKSMAFAGVPISGLFSKPGGNFNLYGKTYFHGADGKTVYAFEGVDTENWKGFSVRISKIAPDVVKKLAKSSILEGRSATPVKSPVQQVAKETKAEIAKRNAETHKVIERAAKRAGEESLRKTKEKVAPPKDLPITEKDIKAMAKKLKLPGGAGAVVNDTSYTWNKKGGFADSVLNPLRDNLKANGFTETDAKTLGLTGTAGSYFTDGKYVVYTAAHLGAIKTDNWYLITLTPFVKTSNTEATTKRSFLPSR